MIKKRIVAIVLSLCACFSLCGAGFFDSTKVVIDTENNHVYKYYSVDEVGDAFEENAKSARENFHKEYVLLSGVIVEVGKNILLSGKEGNEVTIYCDYDKELRESALTYSVGDNIALFGQIHVDVFDKDVHIKAERIIKSPEMIKSKDMYFLLDGSSFDKADTKRRTLKNETVEFCVPSFWQSIELSIQDEGLGTIEGYQYILNKIPGRENEVPESVFVCYFDNKSQLADYLNDSDETELIEQAIVNNILGSVGRFPTKKVDTYYNSEYTYYSGAFKNAFDTGAGYHTEFIFQPVDEEGIVFILYVYKDAKYLTDVLFLARFLEIKK